MTLKQFVDQKGARIVGLWRDGKILWARLDKEGWFSPQNFALPPDCIVEPKEFLALHIESGLAREAI